MSILLPVLFRVTVFQKTRIWNLTTVLDSLLCNVTVRGLDAFPEPSPLQAEALPAQAPGPALHCVATALRVAFSVCSRPAAVFRSCGRTEGQGPEPGSSALVLVRNRLPSFRRREPAVQGPGTRVPPRGFEGRKLPPETCVLFPAFQGRSRRI